jgi:phenylacetate-CoA ligase
MNDVTSWAADDTCACGTHQRGITKIYGRSDNMVKLRGVNVFPEAIGAVISAEPRSNGEYVCLLDGTPGGREDMTVMAEARDSSVDAGALAADLGVRLKEALGVKLIVEVVKGGALDPMTGLSATSKIKRLIDRRSEGAA